MFYHIAGELVLRESSVAVIDCGGVGYKLTTSANTADALGREKGRVKLYTYIQVREDAIELFGFYTEDELTTFKLLTSVSGVGPKAAISILSIMTPDRLAGAVCSEDVRSISKAPGVGAKTAARIVLELKDKLGSFVGTSQMQRTPGMAADEPARGGGKLGEAADALAVLGYNRAEILNVLRGMDLDAMSLEEIIRTALKRFAG